MWTADDVKERFSESASIERRSPRGLWGPSQKLGFWPEYQMEFADYVAQSGDLDDIKDRVLRLRAVLDREARNNRPVPPSPGEISRANEVLLEWTPLIAEDRRKLVWYWAHSAAGGLNFATVCRRVGWVRRTAYDRLDRVCERLAARFNNAGLLLRVAGDIDGCTHSGPGAFIDCTLNELPEAQSPRSWNDGSTSADQPDIRDFSWAQKQAAREAKRRAKLGLEAA